MPAKTKQTQPVIVTEPQGRDLFQTPKYAVDLLIPFIPKHIKWIWEPACGDGKIVHALYASKDRPLVCYQSDIRKSTVIPHNIGNFLTDDAPFLFSKEDWAIITNPPFSAKIQFYHRCREFEVPFALLIPADYSGWNIKAVMEGAEKIIPRRRIDYITPNILKRIHEGETLVHLEEVHGYGKSIDEWKEQHGYLWDDGLEFCKGFLYKSIEEVPIEFLHKYSSSDFHSMWLTWGFGIGKSETFVELTNEEKKGNI